MTDAFDGKKWGSVVPIPFTFTNATTGESDSDLTFAGGASTLFVAPQDGHVVGISARANAAITAGSITFSPHKAGTEFTEDGIPQPVLNSGAQASYANATPRAISFDAGDTLGVSITTTTTLDPTNSLDIDCVLFVALDPN